MAFIFGLTQPQFGKEFLTFLALPELEEKTLGMITYCGIEIALIWAKEVQKWYFFLNGTAYRLQSMLI